MSRELVVVLGAIFPGYLPWIDVACIVEGKEVVVDGYRRSVGVFLEGGAADKATNMATNVSSNLDGHD